MNGDSAFNGAKGKPYGLVLFVFEDANTSMLVLQWTVNFLQMKTQSSTIKYTSRMER